jgi:hypothetical protein
LLGATIPFKPIALDGITNGTARPAESDRPLLINERREIRFFFGITVTYF